MQWKCMRQCLNKGAVGNPLTKYGRYIFSIS